jgi:hypothetical protein
MTETLISTRLLEMEEVQDSRQFQWRSGVP